MFPTTVLTNCPYNAATTTKRKAQWTYIRDLYSLYLTLLYSNLQKNNSGKCGDSNFHQYVCFMLQLWLSPSPLSLSERVCKYVSVSTRRRLRRRMAGSSPMTADDTQCFDFKLSFPHMHNNCEWVIFFFASLLALSVGICKSGVPLLFIPDPLIFFFFPYCELTWNITS